VRGDWMNNALKEAADYAEIPEADFRRDVILR
jgi:hypothetical protein